MTKTFAIAIPLLAVVMLAAPVRVNAHQPERAVSEQTAQADSSASIDLKSSLDKAVESYRKIIVLLDDDASLNQEEKIRCVDVGRSINQEKQQLLDHQRAIAYLNLADAYVRVGKPKEANQNEKFLELPPGSANADEVRQRIVELQDKH